MRIAKKTNESTVLRRGTMKGENAAKTSKAAIKKPKSVKKVVKVSK